MAAETAIDTVAGVGVCSVDGTSDVHGGFNHLL